MSLNYQKGEFQFTNKIDFGLYIYPEDSTIHCYFFSTNQSKITKNVDEVLEAITLIKKRYDILKNMYHTANKEKKNTPFKNEIAEMWRKECEHFLVPINIKQ
jgi:hypothetical protein